MTQIKTAAAMSGEMIGTMMLRMVRIRRAPSIAAASNSSTGLSARKDRITQAVIGGFIAVYEINR